MIKVYVVSSPDILPTILPIIISTLDVSYLSNETSVMCMHSLSLSLYLQESDQKDYINVKGCVPQFEKWLQDNLTLVAGIFIGVALLQVSSTKEFKPT